MIKTSSFFRCAAVAVAIMLCRSSLATTIIVTSNADSGPGTLRDALAMANDGDVINFAVTGTILLTSGQLVVNDSLTIAGPGADQLTVDANRNSRVFLINQFHTATISGLTITHGNVIEGVGGGILNDHSVLTVNVCTVTDNFAFSGGGIDNDGSVTLDEPDVGPLATLTVDSCTISNNPALQGGGIFNDAQNGSATATVRSSLINGNMAQKGSGGGIHNNGFRGNAMLRVINSTLSGNSAASQGGGIFNEGFEPMAPSIAVLRVDDCTFSGNSAPSVNGGGISNDGTGGSVSLAISVFKTGASGTNLVNNNGGMIMSLGYNLSNDNGGGFLM